ncbi:MAG: hypothetical protein Q4Q03_05360 [Bowdeniella nasicola]|nr:hypothetical protein [Bowdeniella nasicola]
MTISHLTHDHRTQLLSASAIIPHTLGYIPAGSIAIQPLHASPNFAPLIHLPMRRTPRRQDWDVRLARLRPPLPTSVIITVFPSVQPDALELPQVLAMLPAEIEIYGGVQVLQAEVELWWQGAFRTRVDRTTWHAMPTAAAQITAGSTIEQSVEALRFAEPNQSAQPCERVPTATEMAHAWAATAEEPTSLEALRTVGCGLTDAHLRDAFLHEVVLDPQAPLRFRPVTRNDIAASYHRAIIRKLPEFAGYLRVLSQVSASTTYPQAAYACAIGAYLSWYCGASERAEMLCTQALRYDHTIRLAQLVRAAVYTGMLPPWAEPSGRRGQKSQPEAQTHAVWW